MSIKLIKNMRSFNLAFANPNQKRLVLAFLIIFILLAVVAVFLLVKKPFWQKPAEEEAQNKAIETPAAEFPQTNPFEEAKTNPFKDIKTNPFD